jgi:peptidylprolyl isomerase
MKDDEFTKYDYRMEKQMVIKKGRPAPRCFPLTAGSAATMKGISGNGFSLPAHQQKGTHMAIKLGDTVFAHYRGTFEDGTEFDSSEGGEPLEFVMGDGMIIPGFEAAVNGREVGDKVTVLVEPKDGYGERNEEMILIVPRSEVPEGLDPEEGMMLQLSLEEGDVDVVVSRVTESEVELDGNHPLAGKRLKFDIEVVDIKAS